MQEHGHRCMLGVLALSFALAQASAGQLRVSDLFSDGMVMQRGKEVSVFGHAAPGDRVSITFDGETYSAEADDSGAWRVPLPPAEAGGPFEMLVRTSTREVRVENILVGDVWVASGQSNMEWTVADAEGAPGEDLDIRHYKVPLSWSFQPQDTLTGGAWTSADADHVGDFTAVGYYFARALRERTNVPVGIINTTWGGTRIESWMSAEALALDEASLNHIFDRERARQDSIRRLVRARVDSIQQENAGLVGGPTLWASPDLDDDPWLAIPVPSPWEPVGFSGMDGIAWYRTEFELTDDDARKRVSVGLGQIDDSDVSWVNGVEVGRMDMAWTVDRVYEVPPSALRVGRNVIAVRVEDVHGGGGIAGPPESVFLDVGGSKRPLSREWRFMPEVVRFGPVGGEDRVPTLLWNQMVHPLLEFPVTGFIWYQGESNADVAQDAREYRQLFIDMIGSWRAAWGQGDLPFLWAQLASYHAADEEPPMQSNWATLRESQSAALALSRTGQAVLLDVGNADDIHPRNKRDVGRRLALAARKIAYGETLTYSGPTYRSHEIKQGRIIVSFDHAGHGLDARGPSPLGFAIAGRDRRFFWANARIEDDRVVVWSELVPDPLAVRYAWADNPDHANLYNAEGLPAAPFRSDDW